MHLLLKEKHTRLKTHYEDENSRKKAPAMTIQTMETPTRPIEKWRKSNYLRPKLCRFPFFLLYLQVNIKP